MIENVFISWVLMLKIILYILKNEIFVNRFLKIGLYLVIRCFFVIWYYKIEIMCIMIIKIMYEIVVLLVLMICYCSVVVFLYVCYL